MVNVFDKESAVSVWCPNCNAPAYTPCTQPTSTGRRPMQTFHLARVARFDDREASLPNAPRRVQRRLRRVQANALRTAAVARAEAMIRDIEKEHEAFVNELTPEERVEMNQDIIALRTLIDLARDRSV